MAGWICVLVAYSLTRNEGGGASDAAASGTWLEKKSAAAIAALFVRVLALRSRGP